MMTRKLLFLFIFCCSTIVSIAQTNDCSTSLAGGQLTVGSSCSTVNFNSNNNSDYWNSNHTCNASDRDDAWGWFTATATTTIITYNSSQDAILTLFTGACDPNMTSLACSDSTSSGDETITYSTTVGVIYMVRIQRYNTNNSMSGTICVYSPPPPPANDNCAGASLLTVSPSDSCVSSVSGTTVSATQSIAAINCGFTGNADDDVWYRFIATGPMHTVTVTPGTLTDAVIDVRSGACNGTNIDCADATVGSNAESLTLTGLTPSTTYYVRVYSYGGSSDAGTFNICVTTPTDPCSTLTTIASCNTSLNAFIPAGNGVYNTGSCGASTPGKEKIYTFTPTISGNYTIQHNSSSDVVDYLFKVAGTCNATGWTCIMRALGATTSGNAALTAGTTYLLMLDSEATTGDTINFSISCPSVNATNTTCTTAIPLPCGTSNLFGTTVGTSNTSHNTGCSMSNYGVWYSFVGDGNETTISVVPYGGYDIEFAVVRGACTSLTNLRCQDIAFGKENYTFTTVSGVNYRVYVAHYQSGNSTRGNFAISRTCTSSCSLTPIVNTPTCGVIAGGLGLNGGDPPAINCSTSNVADLEANYIKLGNTTSYRVEQIPYNPPATGSLLSLSGLLDDTWSAELSLLFPTPFCFYGNSYTKFVYGANGMITFDLDHANTASGYEFDEGLPSTDEALFLNTIYGVYHDIDPSRGGNIGRRIENVNGCRRMIIVWEDVPMFLDNSILFSGKMVLYEKTNIIEIYIEEKRLDTNSAGYPTGPWNYGNAIVGLQGSTGDAITAPCRNGTDANWVVTNGEAWRFVPNDGNITQLKWYADGVYLPGYDNDDTPSIPTLATTTYTAEVTYTPNCGAPFTISDDVVVTVNDKVWNGSVDTNWYLPANWTPTGIPTINDCVTIPDTASTNGRSPIANVVTAASTVPAPSSDIARAKYVRVLNNGSLEVSAKTFLEIDEWIENEPNALTIIRDTGSLVQLSNVASNNNTGNIRMQRGVTGVGAQDYVYWSSPVENFNVANINTAASELRYQWNPTTANIYGTWIPASGIMTIGRGYIVRGLATPPSPIPANNVEFVGRPNNGIINYPITRGNYTGAPYAAPGNTMATNLDDNWNLIGNPYPSAISANAFLTTNAAALTGNSAPIQGTVYLWRHLQAPNSPTDPFYENYVYNYFASDYIAYNQSGSSPSGFAGRIGAGQGFFVLMDDAVPSGTNVRFDNTMRSSTTSNSQFYRTENDNETSETLERNRIWLDLITESNLASSTLVGYIEGATDGQDRLFDGPDLIDTSVRLYSLLDGSPMAIQGKALPFDENDRVLLGFEVVQNGTYKIAINSLDGLFADRTQNIYLEDTYLNTIHDLRTTPYTFTTDSGTFNDRFILRYTNETLSTPEQVADYAFNIIGLKNYIKVTSANSPINSIIVYDILGRVLADYKDINAQEFHLDLVNQSKGTLIVKATLINGRQKIKKIIY